MNTYKIISWNIWGGKYLQDVIQFLQTSKADFIGLQEVIETATPQEKQNHAAIIAQALGYNWVYYKAVTIIQPGQEYSLGNAFLSRYPIEDHARHFLSDPEMYQQTAETEPRIAIEANVRIDGVLLHFLVTHLAYSHAFQPSAMRKHQIEHLYPLVPSQRAFLLGDFNAPAYKKELHLLEQHLVNADSNPIAPTWSTYPTNYKGFVVEGLEYRLDHIFATPDLSIPTFSVEQSMASDHLPISATFSL